MDEKYLDIYKELDIELDKLEPCENPEKYGENIKKFSLFDDNISYILSNNTSF